MSLITIFRDTLIPWSQNDLGQRLIVATQVMKKNSVPSGVEVTSQLKTGKNIIAVQVTK